MNLLKILGGVGAGILAAGGLILAGRSGLGVVEKENPETTPENGETPAAPETPATEPAEEAETSAEAAEA